ncbi:MAG: hypothetical protein WA705_12275 [Candidatus Ozemobacteraceae bacterium]
MKPNARFLKLFLFVFGGLFLFFQSPVFGVEPVHPAELRVPISGISSQTADSTPSTATAPTPGEIVGTTILKMGVKGVTGGFNPTPDSPVIDANAANSNGSTGQAPSPEQITNSNSQVVDTPDQPFRGSSSPVSSGLQNAQGVIKSQFSPQGMATTVAVTAGTELIRQAATGNDIDVGKAAKTLTTPEFAGSVLGSAVGAAAGAGVTPLLRGIPYVGGAAAALAPVIGGVSGSTLGGLTAGNIRDGSSLTGALNDGLKKVDWGSVVGQSVGSVVGTVLGSSFGPVGTVLGGIVGSYLGDLTVKGIRSLLSKNNGAANTIQGSPSLSITDRPLSFSYSEEDSALPAECFKIKVVGSGTNPFSE